MIPVNRERKDDRLGEFLTRCAAAGVCRVAVGILSLAVLRPASRLSAGARAGSVACYAAAAVLVTFAMLFAAALPAQAQTTIWTATLTPRATFSGTPVPLGCDNSSTGNRKCSNSNTLSDDFTDDGTTYAVTKFFTRNGVLTFRLNTGATAATQGLTLVIDGEEFVLKEADQINGAKTQWKWNSTTLGWTAGTDVAVSLVATDAPATGQPTISGGGQVGKTLTAATDDIEDPDGLPTTPTFTYQWVRVDGSTDTDIPGAASETYTLTASDLGKQIKVTVSFTDFRGHAEGPLTSDAYPPNGTVVAAVGPCPAVNDWCGTVTVADAEGDGRLLGYEYDKFGSLDDDQIEYRGQNIEVWTVHTYKELSRAYFYFGSIFPRVPRGTVVTVGEHMFTTDMESDDGSTGDSWEDPPDLVWSDGQEVRISLVLGSFPAEGAVTISGTAETGQTLTADPSGFSDVDGLTNAVYTYQWVRVDGATRTDISGATGDTYLLVGADADKQVEVRVSFTDDKGYAETLTSDAYPSSGTIVPEPLPALSFDSNEVTVDEDAGSATLTVELAPASTGTVTVDYATRDGLGGAKAGDDYTATSGTLTFAATETSKTITVPILNDDAYENNESFDVDLSNPTGATLPDPPSAAVRIDSEDAVPTASLADVTVDEGAGTMTLTLRLSHPSDAETGYFTIYDEDDETGTATEGEDYDDFLLGPPGRTARITVPAGSLSQTFDITIVDDSEDEPDETIIILWTVFPNHDVTPTSFNFTGTITDNDGSNNAPTTPVTPPTTPPKLTPDAPQYLRATPGNAQVTLTWDAPYYDGGDITGYAHRYRESDKSFGFDAPEDWNDIPGETDARNYTVTGLTNGVEYTFQVRAENAHGGGTPANATVTLPEPDGGRGEVMPVNTESEEIPTELMLMGNYPNPFNPETVIDYALPQTGHVRLAVYDMTGKTVAVLMDGIQPQGQHTARFNADGLPTGTYVYRLTAGAKTLTRTMTMVR